ncbi:MAG TPA: hypothetical protein GX729_07100 [Firmicutes bacterium]|jgi:hypothetical protein|nr:hypothetical protein [Bacillota bacterium]
MDKEILQAIRELLREELKAELEPMKKDIKEIKDIIIELEPQNANRHLELKKFIAELRQDLANVEIITSSNWNEIAKLKKAK